MTRPGHNLKREDGRFAVSLAFLPRPVQGSGLAPAEDSFQSSWEGGWGAVRGREPHFFPPPIKGPNPAEGWSGVHHDPPAWLQSHLAGKGL